MSQRIDRIRKWIEWLRTNFTPAAWKEVYEAGKALFELFYTFGYFFVYPFVESCKAFWFDVLKPFWSHVKVAWTKLAYRAKNLWKEIKDIFKKEEEVPVEPPVEPVEEPPVNPW